MAVAKRRNCKYCGLVLKWDDGEKSYVCPGCGWVVPREQAKLWDLVDVQHPIDQPRTTTEYNE